MEKFSKVELQWMQIAVLEWISNLKSSLEHDPDNIDPWAEFVIRLRIEGLTIVEEKLNRAIKNGSKRIAIT